MSHNQLGSTWFKARQNCHEEKIYAAHKFSSIRQRFWQ